MGDFTTQAAKLEHAENRYKNTTIEEAVAQMVKASGDNQNTVINTLAKILQNNNFRLIYNECIEMIPDQKSVHVECRFCELGVREFLLQVAEKGWDGVYIVHEQIHIWLVTRERDNKGRIQYPREKIIRRDPETGKAIINQKTGKEKFTYRKAVRQHKTVTEKYTGEPILFKKSKARRNEFVNLLTENDLPDPWTVKEPSSKQKDTTETPKDEISWGNDWGDILITIETSGNLLLKRISTGECKREHASILKFTSVKNNKINAKGKVMERLAKGLPVKTGPTIKKHISGIRTSLKSYFKIDKDPFYEYDDTCGYKPKFVLKETTTNQDNRASSRATSHSYNDDVQTEQGFDELTELERLIYEQQQDAEIDQIAQSDPDDEHRN